MCRSKEKNDESFSHLIVGKPLAKLFAAPQSKISSA